MPIYRRLQDHWLWQDANKLKWWLDLLISANHKSTKVLVGNKLVDCERGQSLQSLCTWAKQWNVDRRTVKKFFAMLENEQMIVQHNVHNTTLITICNYDSYQMRGDSEVTDVVNDKYPIGNRWVTETKKKEEVKEINITTTPRAREESIEWDDNTENSYLERFKAQGSARDAMRMTGKTLREVMEIMDVYRAKRKLQNRGHESYDQFCNLFVWYLEQGKIPQTSAQPQSGVISGQAIFDRIK
jgi:hypothetical protein